MAAARREAARSVEQRRHDLEDVVALLTRLDAERSRLMSERDQLVEDLRAAGLSWSELAGVAGVSRQALMLRASPR